MAQPWLPPTALFDGVLTAAVARGVDAWRSRWIASSGRYPVRLDACNLSDLLPRDGWRTACGTLRFLADAKMKTRLAAAVLQSPRAARGLTASDSALLDALCQKISCNLLDQHAGMFGAATGYQPVQPEDIAGPPAMMRFRINGPGGVFGFLTVSAGAAAHARRSLAKPGERKLPLETRSRAIACHPIKVSVQIGSGRISVAELGSLAMGDVLVLDRRTTEPLDTTFNGQRPAGRAVGVRRKGSALFIQATDKQANGTA